MPKKLTAKTPSVKAAKAKSSIEPPKTETVKVTIYLPPYYAFLVEWISVLNDEPKSAIIRRLLLPEIDRAAANAYKGSMALFHALKAEQSPKVWGRWAKNYFMTLAGHPGLEKWDEE